MSQVDLGARLNLDSAPLEQGVQNVINVFRQLQNQLSSISVTDTIKGDPFGAQLKFAENFVKKMNEALTNVEKLDLTGSLKQSVDAIRKSMEEVTKAGGNPIKKLGDLLVTAQEQFGTFATSINNKQIPLTNLEDAREKITKIFNSISKEKLSTEQIQAYSDQINKIIDGLAAEFPQLAAPIQTVREKLNGLFKDLTSQKAPANFLGDYKVKFENALQEMAAIRVKIDPLAEAEVKINEVINGIKKKTISVKPLQDYINKVKEIFDNLSSLAPQLQAPIDKAKEKLDTFYSNIKASEVSTIPAQKFRDEILRIYSDVSKAKVDFTPLRTAEKEFEAAFNKLSKSGKKGGKFKVEALDQFYHQVLTMTTKLQQAFPALSEEVGIVMETLEQHIGGFARHKVPTDNIDQFKETFIQRIKELENITVNPDPLLKIKSIIEQVYSSLENRTIDTKAVNNYSKQAIEALETLKKTEASLAEPISKVEPILTQFFKDMEVQASNLKTGELIRIDITRGLKAIETAKVDLKPFKEAEEAINKIFTSIGKKKLPVDTFKEYQNQVLAVFDKLANSDTSLKIPLEKAKADLNTFFSSISGKEISVKQLVAFKEKVKTIFGEIKNYNINLEPLRNAEKEISAIFTKINSKELKVKGFTGVKVEIENVIDQLQKAAPQLSEPIAVAKDKLNKLLETFSKKKISTQNLEEFQTEVRKIFEGVSNEKIRLDPLYIAKEAISKLFAEISKQEINPEAVNKYVIQVTDSLNSLKAQFPTLKEPIEAVTSKITSLLETVGTKKIPVTSAKNFEAEIFGMFGNLTNEMQTQLNAQVAKFEGLFGELQEYIKTFSVEGAVKGDPFSVQIKNAKEARDKIKELLEDLSDSFDIKNLPQASKGLLKAITDQITKQEEQFTNLKTNLKKSQTDFEDFYKTIGKGIDTKHYDELQKKISTLFKGIGKTKISVENINEYSSKIDNLIEEYKTKAPQLVAPLEQAKEHLQALLKEFATQKAPTNLLDSYKAQLEQTFAGTEKVEVPDEVAASLKAVQSKILTLFDSISKKKINPKGVQDFVKEVIQEFDRLRDRVPTLSNALDLAEGSLNKLAKAMERGDFSTTPYDKFKEKIELIFSDLSKMKININPLKETERQIESLLGNKRIVAGISADDVGKEIKGIETVLGTLAGTEKQLQAPIKAAIKSLQEYHTELSKTKGKFGKLTIEEVENFKKEVRRQYNEIEKFKINLGPFKESQVEFGNIFDKMEKDTKKLNDASIKQYSDSLQTVATTLKKQFPEAGGIIDSVVEATIQKLQSLKGTKIDTKFVDDFRNLYIRKLSELSSLKIEAGPILKAKSQILAAMQELSNKEFSPKAFQDYGKKVVKILTDLQAKEKNLAEPIKIAIDQIETYFKEFEGKEIDPKMVRKISEELLKTVSTLKNVRVDVTPFKEAKEEIDNLFKEMNENELSEKSLQTYAKAFEAVFDRLKSKVGELPEPLRNLQDEIRDTLTSFVGSTDFTAGLDKIQKRYQSVFKAVKESNIAEAQEGINIVEALMTSMFGDIQAQSKYMLDTTNAKVTYDQFVQYIKTKEIKTGEVELSLGSAERILTELRDHMSKMSFEGIVKGDPTKRQETYITMFRKKLNDLSEKLYTDAKTQSINLEKMLGIDTLDISKFTKPLKEVEEAYEKFDTFIKAEGDKAALIKIEEQALKGLLTEEERALAVEEEIKRRRDKGLELGQIYIEKLRAAYEKLYNEGRKVLLNVEQLNEAQRQTVGLKAAETEAKNIRSAQQEQQRLVELMKLGIKPLQAEADLRKVIIKLALAGQAPDKEALATITAIGNRVLAVREQYEMLDRAKKSALASQTSGGLLLAQEIQKEQNALVGASVKTKEEYSSLKKSQKDAYVSSLGYKQSLSELRVEMTLLTERIAILSAVKAEFFKGDSAGAKQLSRDIADLSTQVLGLEDTYKQQGKKGSFLGQGKVSEFKKNIEEQERYSLEEQAKKEAEAYQQQAGTVSTLLEQLTRFAAVREVLSKLKGAEAEAALTLVYADEAKVVARLAEFQDLKTKKDMEQYMFAKYNIQTIEQLTKKLSDLQREQQRLESTALKELFNEDSEAANKYKETILNTKQEIIDVKRVMAELYGVKSEDFSTLDKQEASLISEKNKVKIAREQVNIRRKLVETLDLETRHLEGMNLKISDIGKKELQNGAVVERIKNIYKALTEAVGKNVELTEAQKEVLKQIEPLMKKIQAIESNQAGIFNLDFKRMAWFAQLRVYWMMYQVVTTAAQAALDFDKNIAKVSAISQATVPELDKMAVVLAKLGKESLFPASKLAEGFVTIAQAGYSAGEALQMIDAAAKLATGTMSDMNTTTNLLTTIMKAWNLEASKSGEVADKLTSAINASKLSMEGLVTSFNYVTGIAPELNISLEETLALLAQMSNAGINASISATSVRAMLAELLAPHERLVQTLEKVGLTVADVSPELNSLSTVLKRLKDAEFDATESFEGLERRAATGVAVLIKNANTYESMVARMKQTGLATEAADRAMDSLSGKWTRYTNQLSSDFFPILQDLKPALSNLVDILSILTEGVAKFLEAFTKTLGPVLSGMLTSLIGTLKGESLTDIIVKEHNLKRLRELKDRMVEVQNSLADTEASIERLSSSFTLYNKIIDQSMVTSQGKSVEQALTDQTEARIHALEVAEQMGLVSKEYVAKLREELEIEKERIKEAKESSDSQINMYKTLQELADKTIRKTKELTEEYKTQQRVVEALALGKRILLEQTSIEAGAAGLQEMFTLLKKTKDEMVVANWRKIPGMDIGDIGLDPKIETLNKLKDYLSMYKSMRETAKDDLAKQTLETSLLAVSGLGSAKNLEINLGYLDRLYSTYNSTFTKFKIMFNQKGDEFKKALEKTPLAAKERKELLSIYNQYNKEGTSGNVPQKIIERLAYKAVYLQGRELLKEVTDEYEKDSKVTFGKVSKAVAINFDENLRNSMFKLSQTFIQETASIDNVINETNRNLYRSVLAQSALGITDETSAALEILENNIAHLVDRQTRGMSEEDKKKKMRTLIYGLTGDPEYADTIAEQYVDKYTTSIRTALKTLESETKSAVSAAEKYSYMITHTEGLSVKDVTANAEKEFNNYLNRLHTSIVTTSKELKNFEVVPRGLYTEYLGELKGLGSSIKEIGTNAEGSEKAAVVLGTALSALMEGNEGIKQTFDVSVLEKWILKSKQVGFTVDAFLNGLNISKKYAREVSYLLDKITVEKAGSRKTPEIITSAEVKDAEKANEVSKIRNKLEMQKSISYKEDLTLLNDIIQTEHELIQASEEKLRTSEEAIKAMIGVGQKYSEIMSRVRANVLGADSESINKDISRVYGLQEEKLRDIGRKIKNNHDTEKEIFKTNQDLYVNEIMRLNILRGIADTFDNRMIVAKIETDLLKNELGYIKDRWKYEIKTTLSAQEYVESLKDENLYLEKINKIEKERENKAITDRDKVGTATVQDLKKVVDQGKEASNASEELSKFYKFLDIYIDTYSASINELDPEGLSLFLEKLRKIEVDIINSFDETYKALQDIINSPDTDVAKKEEAIRKQLRLENARRQVQNDLATVTDTLTNRQKEYSDKNKEVLESQNAQISTTKKINENVENIDRYSTNINEVWGFIEKGMKEASKEYDYMATQAENLGKTLGEIPNKLSDAFGSAATDFTMMTIFGEDTDRMKELKDRYKELGEEKKKAAAVNDKVAVEKLNREMERTSDLMRQEKSLLTQLAVAWKSFADTVIRSLMEMMAKMVAWKALETIGMTALFAGTGGVTPDMEQMVKFGKGGVTSFKSFAGGGMTTSPTLALLGDNPSKKELIIPSENIQKNNVSGYVKEKDSGQPYQITIVNTLSPEDIAGAVAQEAGQKVIINTIGKDILKQGPTFKVIKEAGRR